MTKEEHLSLANNIFKDLNVNITTEGRPMLGAAIGKDSYIKSFVGEKVDGWVSGIERLAHYAESQPHVAFAALTHGLSSKWSYLYRAIPSINSFMQPLEDSLRTKLIPMLTGKEPPNDTERDLLALPVRLGGLGIRNL